MKLSRLFTATCVVALPLAVVVSPGTAQAASAAPAPPRPHVYLVPHQDDEVLSMAATIRRSVRQVGARNVHLVLMTTGDGSGARATLAGGFYPKADLNNLVRRSLTVAQFSAARDVEFKASADRLGVPASNVHLSLPRWKRVPDRALNATNAAKFVAAAIDRFGRGAAYNTMSDVDPSAAHRALGSQMRRIAAQRKVNVTYHYPAYQLPAPRALVRVAPHDNADRAAIRAAARQYGAVRASTGRWGIGWLSVPSAFGGEALNAWQQRSAGVWRPRPLKAPAKGLFESLSSYTHR